MTWFKVDDGFWSHPKVITLPPEAIALWVRAGSYAGQHLTNGHIPAAIVPVLGGVDAARTLVSAGLWDDATDGYQFHDWAKYQPSRAEVEKDREANAERQRRFRERKRNASRSSDADPVSNGVTNPVTNPVSNADSNADSNPVSNPVSNGTPTRPNPTRPDQVTPSGVTHTKTDAKALESASAPNLDALFDEAYAAWPKKVERKKSLERFKRIAKSRDPRELADDVIEFGAAYGKHTPLQYVPALAVWLNGERWTDDLPQAREVDVIPQNPWAASAPRSASPVDKARQVADNLRELERRHDASF